MNQAQRAQHARHREVWGVDQPEQAPGAVPSVEQFYGVRPLNATATPAALEHDEHCTADAARIEAVAWSNGTTATRCLDCSASAPATPGGDPLRGSTLRTGGEVARSPEPPYVSSARGA